MSDVSNKRVLEYDTPVPVPPSPPFIVNTTADTGDTSPDGVCDDGAGNCTLREAIQEANASVDLNNIHFSIGSGSQTIALGGSFTDLATLPTITSPVIIDGTTQPGYAASPLVELDAAAVPRCPTYAFTCPAILPVTAGGSTVRGLAIRNETIGHSTSQAIPSET